MQALLIKVLIWFATGLAARILISLGIGIFTFAFLQNLQSNIQQNIMTFLNGLPADILGIMGIIGVDMYISIVLSALTISAYLKSVKIFIGKS